MSVSSFLFQIDSLLLFSAQAICQSISPPYGMGGWVGGGGGGGGHSLCNDDISFASDLPQEASRNADELLKAEEEEKKLAEKRRLKNKRVSDAP